MNNKYKGKGKVYKCPYENHYFYVEIENNFGISFPSCKKPICCFCLKKIYSRTYRKCCIKRKLGLMHLYGKKLYLKLDQREHFSDTINSEKIIFIIPLLNFFFLVGIFFNAFFYKILRKHNNGINDFTYEDLLRKNSKYWVINIIINIITTIFLVLSFFIFSILISILLLILIIIRKKWYMYLVGFFLEDFEYFFSNWSCIHYMPIFIVDDNYSQLNLLFFISNSYINFILMNSKFIKEEFI